MRLKSWTWEVGDGTTISLSETTGQTDLCLSIEIRGDEITRSHAELTPETCAEIGRALQNRYELTRGMTADEKRWYDEAKKTVADMKEAATLAPDHADPAF